jgi:hypothetical protein
MDHRNGEPDREALRAQSVREHKHRSRPGWVQALPSHCQPWHRRCHRGSRPRAWA